MVDQISKEGWFPSASGTLAADKTKLELVLHFLKVRLILKSIYQLMQYCALFQLLVLGDSWTAQFGS